MVYAQNNPALFIIGLSLLSIWYGADTGLINPVLEHLALGKSYKYHDELRTLPLYFELIAVVTGLWHWLGKHREGHLDYYSPTISGGMLILFITMLVRWFIAPEIEVISIGLGEVGNTGKVESTGIIDPSRSQIRT